ncbi:conserved hypothetical protein [Ricinus communis]|uniref:Uncharacterized protein n=1 Tax=Ricinus communis TaxID=3988 RepID=B9SUW0_RICCO|nr:conserved hypothetical protein [Ricinus communis]
MQPACRIASLPHLPISDAHTWLLLGPLPMPASTRSVVPKPLAQCLGEEQPSRHLYLSRCIAYLLRMPDLPASQVSSGPMLGTRVPIPRIFRARPGPAFHRDLARQLPPLPRIFTATWHARLAHLTRLARRSSAKSLRLARPSFLGV